MNFKFENIDVFLEKYIPFLFIALTLLLSLLRTPFYDETHAFVISQLNLSEIFYLSRIEGHPIFWYLLLKPFSNLNFYPYSMMLINWVFASIMIFVFWKKAPFNNWIKLLLTFSYPFFQYFAVVSRPYALGVLAIFLLSIFYEKSLKRPILYSLLLIFCANISVITFFVAFGFGILFLYECYKNKLLFSKKTLLMWIIFAFGILLLACQFLFLETPKMQSANAHSLFLKHFVYFVCLPFSDLENKNLNQILLQLTTSVSFFYFIFLFFKKAKSSLFLMIFSCIPMIIMFLTIYIGDFWHYYFIFIAFICALWINWDKFKNEKIANILLVLLIFFNMTSYSITQNGKNQTNQPIF